MCQLWCKIELLQLVGGKFNMFAQKGQLFYVPFDKKNLILARICYAWL